MDFLVLEDQVSYDFFRSNPTLTDGFGGLKLLKSLIIRNCVTEECLTSAPATAFFSRYLGDHAPTAIFSRYLGYLGYAPTAIFSRYLGYAPATTIVFPVLEKLYFSGLPTLKEIYRGPAPEGSFRKLTYIEISDCDRLEYLFPLQIVGCLTELKRLTIQRCAKMKEVIWKEQRDTHIATNGIEFPNLEFLYLESLPCLVGFCTGIDQIDFPKLRCMHLRLLNFRCIFDIKSSLPSNSEQNFDVGSLSLFPPKVTFPCLEDLILQGLYNVIHKYYSEPLISSFPTLKKLEVSSCGSLRYVFNSSVAGHLVHLKELNISYCSKMEAVVEREEEIEVGPERKVDTTLFPQLGKLQLINLPNLRRFCHFTLSLELPMLSELDIRNCPSMEEFSVGHVSFPKLSLPDVSWNGDLNNALRFLQKRERFAGVEDLQGRRRVEDEDIHEHSLDSDETLSLFSKKREKAERETFAGVKEELQERCRVADNDIHEHSLDSDELELDGYDSESDGSIERNNSTITCRQTLPPNPQRGRCICFRTADLYTDTSVTTRFYSVPFDFFGDGGDDVNSSNPEVEGLKPFYKCTDFATTSRLSSVGSSLFVVGGSKETQPRRVSITTEKMYRFDTTAPENDWYKRDELSMLTPRAFPITVAMDGKLYIFGGSGPDAPLAELFDPCLKSSTSVPLPPPPRFPINGWHHLVVAALQPSKKILVASRLSDVVSVYDIVKGVWEELDHKVDFSSVRGQAAVVQNGKALCWCSKNVEEVHAYDLVDKRWFKSPIQRLEEDGMRDPDGPTHYCPIFPLDDNHLCLLWKDHMGYDGTNLPLLHCIKIRVSMARGESRFDAVVVASRTYALGLHESIFDAHVFGHDNGGRTWECSGYEGGERTVLSIASYKTCSKCWGTGHTESSCNQVGSGAGMYG